MTADRGDKLAEHKVYFARDDNNGKQIQSLGRLIEFVKPTILMGLSTIGGAFTPELIQKMAQLNEHPIIFPLSNPSSKSECTFEEAVKYTDGKVLFASGSPFPEIQHNGKELTPGQGTYTPYFLMNHILTNIQATTCMSSQVSASVLFSARPSMLLRT